MNQQLSQKLSKKVKIAYGVGDLGGCLFFTFMGLWVLHYFTDVIGVSSAMAGSIIALGKIWDAITDPMIGYLSDRTKTPWGRRRPWMFGGVIPVMIGMYFLFTPPNFTGKYELFFWCLFSYCFLSTATTCVNIPYSALTPELSRDYHEQSSLNGHRFFFAGIGSLVAAGFTLPIVHYYSTPSLGFSRLALIYSLVIGISTLMTVFLVREKTTQKVSYHNFIETYQNIFKNKAFLILLGAYCLNIIGLSIIMGMAVYYFKYIHNNESYTTWAMLALLSSSLLFMPLAVKTSQKIHKKNSYILGLSLYFIVMLFISSLGPYVSPAYSICAMIIAGCGQSFCYIMPYAMIPDTIQDKKQNDKIGGEGAYYGFWTFLMKCGQALALLICGQLLSFSDYNVHQEVSTATLSMIKVLIGPITMLFYGGSILALVFYPLEKE